jgi:broad specificity phosphatase PhoE
MQDASRKLVLVKHAPPEVVPEVPSEKWTLSEKGRALCVPLADRIAAYAPAMIVSSDEPKAAETARLVAERLGIPWRTAPGLHEHDRSNVPHMRSGEFISMMELFFRKPGELVLGRETAEQARARFVAAVRRAVEDSPPGNLAIVAHGTVIALLEPGRGQRSPFQVWRAMGLPSFLTLSLPDLELLESVDRVA